MSLEQTHFGKLSDGRAVDLYTLRNRNGLVLKAMTYGGRITELHVPDREGRMADITLGFDRLDPYLDDHAYFGPILGRCALRIAGGRFTLDGVEHRLATNEGSNTLHGGPGGFDKRLWTADPLEIAGANVLRLSYFSPDGEEGFPGDLVAGVTYTLGDDNEFRIEYSAHCDRPTPVSLSHHIYLNLAGAGRGQILDHVLTLAADQYLPTDAQSIPTGEVAGVHGTELDFTVPRRIGDRIGKGLANIFGGYDHYYVLREALSPPSVHVEHPASGRALEMSTDWPGLQFYTANKLDGRTRGIGGSYGRHSGFTLEPMQFPDAMHHANFPSAILRPGEALRRACAYRFMTV